MSSQKTPSPGGPRRAQPFLAPQLAPRTEHGGSLGAGRRKLHRPLDPKRPLHVVMRATQARGPRSLLARANAPRVEALVHLYSRRFQVRILTWSNVGNHLRLLVQGKSRAQLQSFLRVVPGQIAQAIMGATKGRKLATRFWDLLAFSRVVEWGRALRNVQRYLDKNDLEASGLISRAETDRLFALPSLHARGSPG